LDHIPGNPVFSLIPFWCRPIHWDFSLVWGHNFRWVGTGLFLKIGLMRPPNSQTILCLVVPPGDLFGGKALEGILHLCAAGFPLRHPFLILPGPLPHIFQLGSFSFRVRGPPVTRWVFSPGVVMANRPLVYVVRRNLNSSFSANLWRSPPIFQVFLFPHPLPPEFTTLVGGPDQPLGPWLYCSPGLTRAPQGAYLFPFLCPGFPFKCLSVWSVVPPFLSETKRLSSRTLYPPCHFLFFALPCSPFHQNVVGLNGEYFLPPPGGF